MNDGENNYKKYLEEIKRITKSGTGVKTAIANLTNNSNFSNYANSTDIKKKFVYNTTEGNQEDTELAPFNFRTENPSDIDLNRELKHYNIEGDTNVDYSIFLFPIKETIMTEGRKKK